MASSKRITITLPQELAADIDIVSDRMGVTRSALISTLLQQSVPDVRRIIDHLPPPSSDVTEEDVKRFRGESAKIISERIANLLLDDGQEDLFHGK